MAVLSVAVLISAVGIAVPLGYGSARAQGQDPFEIPGADELAESASTPVIDVPAPLPETIDPNPALETAWSHFDALPSEEWEVLGLAPTLGDSPTAAFELVRDSIGFDAYPGVLRGAEGTLTARAGNAFDRALLLKGLLDAQGFTSRFAFGQLSPEVTADLVDRSLEPPVAPLSVPDFSPFGSEFEAAVSDRARRDYALLSDALGDRLGELGADGTAAARSELKNHAWVQLEQADGTWLDLDPTLPDSQPGQTITTAESTPDVMPDEARQTATLRVISETLQDGALSETVSFEVTVDPSIAADQQLLLAFTPASGSGGGGLMGGGGAGVLAGGGEGGSDFVPVLMIDGQAWRGDPIAISTSGGGGGLLGGGDSPIDLSGLFLEVETSAPGAARLVARHPILDRVPAAARAAGSVAENDLLPLGDVDGVPAVFTTITHMMLSTGGSSPRAYAWQQAVGIEEAALGVDAPDAGRSSLAVEYYPLAVEEQTLGVASEQRVIPGVDDTEVRAYVAGPRVYLTSWAIDAGDPTRIVAETDLLLDGIRMLPRDGAAADAAARHQLWYGALQGAIETEHALRAAATFDPADLVLTGVSFDMGKPLTVLSADDASTLAAGAQPSLQATLAAGHLAVIPGDPSQATTWWHVSDDGATKAILAPRLGGTRIGGPTRPPAPPPSSGGKVQRIEKLPENRGSQRRPNPQPVDKFEEAEGQSGKEYGELVEKVANQTGTVAEAGGDAMKALYNQQRLRIIIP